MPLLSKGSDMISKSGSMDLLIGFKLLNNSPQTAAQQYIYSLRGNNIFLYTHVEGNSGRGIMEGQLSTNAAPEEVKTILLKQVIGPSTSNIFVS